MSIRSREQHRIIFVIQSTDHFSELQRIILLWCKLHGLRRPVFTGFYGTGRVSLCLYTTTYGMDQFRRFLSAWAEEFDLALDIKGCIRVS